MFAPRLAAGLLLAAFASASAAQTELLPGQSLTGRLSGKDDARDAEGYLFRCFGLKAPNRPLEILVSSPNHHPVQLALFGSDNCGGRPLTAGPPDWTTSALVTRQGGYSIRVRQGNLGDSLPPFVLTVRERPTELHAGRPLAGALVGDDLVPEDRRGRYDCYAFEGRAGQTVRLRLVNEDASGFAAQAARARVSLHQGADCGAEVAGADGRAAAYSVFRGASPGQEASVQARLPADGAHAVRVHAFERTRYTLAFDLHDEAGAAVARTAALVRVQPPVKSENLEDGVAAFDRGDWAEAVRVFEILLANGSAEAGLRLGNMYERGRGVPRDEARARAVYQRTAGFDGHGAALNEARVALAAMAAEGRGGPRDDVLAFETVRRAAASGLDDAAYALGVAYAEGRGTARDPVQAVRWFRQAGSRHPEARFRLALALRDGVGVARDPVESRRMLEDAADAGSVAAQRELGAMYAGAMLQKVEAVEWYGRAALNGDAEARARLEAYARDGLPSARLFLGRVLLAAGEAGAGRDWLRQATAQDRVDELQLVSGDVALGDTSAIDARFDLAVSLAAAPSGEADLAEAWALYGQVRASETPLAAIAAYLQDAVAARLPAARLKQLRAADAR